MGPTANLFAADLHDANLLGVDLHDALVGNANLTDATITDSTLTDATLIDSTLTNATLTDDNLDGATGVSRAAVVGVTWSDTTCPDGSNSDSDGDTCVNDLSSDT